MKIAVVGTGYVGLVTGTCFAKMGNNVYCVDINEEKIKKLKNGIIPIYEPNLSEMVLENVKAGRLNFTTNLADCIDDVDIVFSAVGTPPNEDDSADLQYVLAVAKEFGSLIKKYTILVTKSTVPVGTAEKVKNAILEALNERNDIKSIDKSFMFDVVSNPEFLKEGTAVNDFMKPERIVVGTDSEKSKELMENLYRPFILNGNRVLFMDIASAEMTKYAANAMLATRISFMNEIANLCDAVGANVNNVRMGIASDSRIGSKFLYSGCGYGGSCFPKDVKALYKTGEQYGVEMNVARTVHTSNIHQKYVLLNKLSNLIFNTNNNFYFPENVCIWGASFKPETDDMREATSLTMIKSLLLNDNVKEIRICDPKALDECKRIFGENEKLIYTYDMYEAAKNADVIFLVTEWQQFRNPDFKYLSEIVSQKILLDGRNIYDRKIVEHEGFYYEGIGC